MAVVFKAQFSGTKCSECGDEILLGEEVSYLNQSLVHSECGYSGFSGYGYWDDLEDDWDD